MVSLWDVHFLLFLRFTPIIVVGAFARQSLNFFFILRVTIEKFPRHFFKDRPSMVTIRTHVQIFSMSFLYIKMFHIFAFTYYILLHCATREYSMMSHLYDEKLLDLRDARASTLLLFITRAVHETCFCCRSCNGRFFFIVTVAIRILTSPSHSYINILPFLSSAGIK